MVDIHAHLLHRMDDGPKNLQASVELVREMIKSGVSEVFATSHYYSAHMPLDEFADRRNRRVNELDEALKNEGIDFKIHRAAEVHIDNLILNLDSLNELCFEGTKNILLEIPHAEKKLENVLPLIEKIMSYYHVRPIIAHVERYPFFTRKIKNLAILKNMGCLIQINASCFIGKMLSRNFGFKAIKEGYVDVIASDCHDTKLRIPELDKAYAVIKNKLGEQVVIQLKDNAKQLTE